MYRMLVVDESMAMQVMFRAVFEPDGYEVICADSHEGIFDICRRTPPNLVIIDMDTSTDERLIVIQSLRRMLSAVPVVAISASPSPVLRRRILDLEAACCLTKPVDFTILESLAENDLSHQR